jgi:hypothetical protein
MRYVVCGSKIGIESKSLQTGNGTGLKPGHYEEKRQPACGKQAAALQSARLGRRPLQRRWTAQRFVGDLGNEWRAAFVPSAKRAGVLTSVELRA